MVPISCGPRLNSKVLATTRAAVLILLCGSSQALAQSDSSFQVVATIGVDDGPIEQVFGAVAAARFGPDGTVLILDAMNCEVREFKISGAYIRKYGRCGDGPGEFRVGSQLIVGSQQVAVIDGVTMREIRFDRSGAHLETKAIEPVGRFNVMIPLRYGYWLGTSSSILTDRPLMDLAKKSRAEIGRQGPALRAARGYPIGIFRDPRRVDTLAIHDHGMTLTLEPRGAVGMLNLRWGPGGSWAVCGDSMIAIVNGFDGRLRIFRVEPNGLRAVRTGRIPLKQQPLDESDWNKLAAVYRQDRSLPPDAVLIGPPYKAQLDEVVFDDQGAAWVRSINYDPLRPSDRVAGTTYLVVPTDGSAQETVTLPGRLTLHAVRGDLLLATTKTEADAPVVRILRRIRR